jgi:hypothetical protein
LTVAQRSGDLILRAANLMSLAVSALREGDAQGVRQLAPQALVATRAAGASRGQPMRQVAWRGWRGRTRNWTTSSRSPLRRRSSTKPIPTRTSIGNGPTCGRSWRCTSGGVLWGRPLALLMSSWARSRRGCRARWKPSWPRPAKRGSEASQLRPRGLCPVLSSSHTNLATFERELRNGPRWGTTTCKG